MSNLKIERIDIKKFGCYKDYRQHSGIGNDFNKENVNIFYGRNYSGKSTYSKIFQSIELGRLPDRYDNVNFEIKLSNCYIKSSEIGDKPLPIDCRVFNRQFIDDNIDLHRDNKLNSFQITVGSNINETLREIENIRHNQLKPQQESLSQIQLHLNIKQAELKNKETALNSRLKTVASNIKNFKNPSVIIGKKYDINDIKKEFKDFSASFPIIPSLENKEELEAFELKVEKAKTRILEDNIAKPEKIILSGNMDNFDFDSLLANLKKSLSKIVSVSDILDKYKNSSEKINWIKHGVELHGENPNKCIFCANNINRDLINNLRQAFSTDLESLEMELANQKSILTAEIERLRGIPTISKEDYFKESETEIENINKDIKAIASNRKHILEKIQSKISEKQRDIFSKIEIENFSWQSFSSVQSKIDVLYSNTVGRIEQFENKRLESIDFLRRYYIAKDFPVPEFEMLSREVANLETEVHTCKKSENDTKIEIRKIESDITLLESSLKSESEAVNRINTILQNSLAHSELSLKSIDAEDSIYFEVSRNGEKAYNLSEGEKSLIAFAYYIAKLESLSTEAKERTVLFIDDPISSLDENNIFYIYNLIFCLIGQNEFSQYFISTHNLDFLKYTNRLPGNKDYYLIEKIKNSSDEPSRSSIKRLPKHLSQKVTEFVFLFEQIYRVATESEDEDNFSVFYNFPNNARKFIETLLYFKYPDYKTKHDDKVNRYFGVENAPFIQRINNEYSHGEDRLDRMEKPINTSEFKHDAILILNSLYENDRDQFKSFLKNSDLTPPAFIRDATDF